MMRSFSTFPGHHPLREPSPVLPRPGAQPRAWRRQGLPLALRVAEEDSTDLNHAAGPFARDRLMALVEAALFAADEPLTLKRLVQVTQASGGDDVRRALKRLAALYEQEETAFRLAEIAGGYQLLTQPPYQPWLLRLGLSASEPKLSGAARETLTIIAYRQPITRADVEAIRGVQCGDLLRQLMERHLIRIAGRDNTLGRPVLYGTTRKFLQMMGLKSISDLPPQGSTSP